MPLNERPAARIRAFVPADGANVSIIFALSLVPLIGLVGLGIDYGVALSAKAKFDNAADAAAIAAVSTVKAYIAANPQSLTVRADAINAGLDRAKRAFAINAGTVPFTTTPTPKITLTSDPIKFQTFTSTVSYTTFSQNNFGQIFKVKNNTISGFASAAVDIPSYIDFYLVLDVSGSMGLPTNSAGQSQLASNNGGCLFACHFNGNTYGYNFAHGPANIKLRIDSVDSAVYQLIQTAKSTQTLQNQYRIGIYPYITDVVQAAPLSSDYTQALQIVTDGSKKPNDPKFFYQLGNNYLDSGVANQHIDTDGTPIGSGGTHFENIFPDLNKHRSSVGNGATSAAPKAFVFLVTDGMNNSQLQSNGNWSNSQGLSPTSQPQEPTNMLSYCQYAQSLGYYISILYIPYIYLNDGESQSNQANNVSPKLYDDLKRCATPGFMFQANSDSDIASAMQAMFAQAVQVAHLNK
jgi:Flp pilus assembly protein TadG